ncbi:MAG TPA: YciI family protein [Nocardioidaceae bacterium]|nr:YciI family protein [Nocardioidaceae bacterium]
MARYLLAVNFEGGAVDTPMSEWRPEEIQAHLDYYAALNDELVANGELVGTTVLTGPDLAKIVTSDGTAPVVTDGPFQEFKEWLAGYQIVEVDSEERALEIAAKVSAAPGPGGVAMQQPIQVRQVMDDAPSDVDEMEAFLQTADGAS